MKAQFILGTVKYFIAVDIQNSENFCWIIHKLGELNFDLDFSIEFKELT